MNTLSFFSDLKEKLLPMYNVGDTVRGSIMHYGTLNLVVTFARRTDGRRQYIGRTVGVIPSVKRQEVQATDFVDPPDVFVQGKGHNLLHKPTGKFLTVYVNNDHTLLYVIQRDHRHREFWFNHEDVKLKLRALEAVS